MSFFEWTADDVVADLLDLTAPSDWDNLVEEYTDGRGSPQLDRIFEIARQHGVVAAIVERRYIDLDWRSEHSSFYSTTFVRYPSVCHRVHFFTERPEDGLRNLEGLQRAYRGYVVLRPLPSAPVGRTMVVAPPELDDGVRSDATEHVDILGWPFTIKAMPFVSQDAQYLRCAHVAMWMVFFHAHLRQGLARRVPAEVHDAALGGVIVDRQTPSEGLSQQQMLAALNTLGLSPAVLRLPQDREVNADAGPLGLFAVVCRYINSNLPPIVISRSHAWLMVAYKRVPSAGHAKLTLYRHDDAAGPYMPVADPWDEEASAHRPWLQALLPLPPKIYMTAERAEAVGRWWFQWWIEELAPADDAVVEASNEEQLTFHVYGLRSSDYKHGLRQRPGFDPGVADEYRLSPWPRSIWVVEAVDRRLRDAGHKRYVLGEVIIDPTANHYPSREEPGLLAVHPPGYYLAFTPDHENRRELEAGSDPYESGRAD